MLTMLRQMRFLIVLFLMLAVVSCATYKRGIIEIRSVNEYAHLSTAEGVTVAADPYDSTEKAKKGFYLDVIRQGFFPINLILKNNTNERVRVLKESIELVDEDGVVHRPVSGKTMFDRFKRNPVARFLAASVISVSVGVVSYVSTVIANRKMKADWQQKEIPNQLVLDPGKQLNGFVYFKVPEDKITRVSKLCLESERLNSRKKVRFELAPDENRSAIILSPNRQEKANDPVSTEPNV